MEDTEPETYMTRYRVLIKKLTERRTRLQNMEADLTDILFAKVRTRHVTVFETSQSVL
jgi:hypothetical protein